MRRSGFKNKVLTPAQRQIKEETRKWKQDLKQLSVKTGFNQRSGSRSGAKGQYYKGEWIPSQWQLECLKVLELREAAGEIKDLVSQEDIMFKIYNQAGESFDLQINIDFTFFDKSINRYCRWDAKPPKVVFHRNGKAYPQKIHAEWLLRWKLLQHAQVDYDYRLLIKGDPWVRVNFGDGGL